MKGEDIPRVAVVTSFFFVASLIHYPLGPTSVHFALNGFAGVLLGPAVFPALFVGLLLQMALFGHGGVTTLGANTVMMGTGGWFAYHVFRLGQGVKFRGAEGAFGFIAGALGVIVGMLIVALLLLTTGREFVGTVVIAAEAHLPVMVIEGAVTAYVVMFLLRVKPGILPLGKVTGMMCAGQTGDRFTAKS
jgi:cobalt/nickel transport system permease protein